MWTLAAVVVGLVGFALLGRSGGSAPDQAARATTSTTADDPDPDVAEADGGNDAGVADRPATEAGDDAPRNGTEAPQSAYPTYLGGDFDDDSPNTITDAGVDEQGCTLHYRGACLPPPPASVSCAQIAERNFDILLGDPYNLDGDDQDGIACDDESIVFVPPDPDQSEPTF
jgi:hypothetical protein